MASAPYALNASRVDQALLADVLASPVASIAAGYDPGLALKADGTVEARESNACKFTAVPTVPKTYANKLKIALGI